MLASSERHDADGLQSFTVAGLFTPAVIPMYCVRLLCWAFVSFHVV